MLLAPAVTVAGRALPSDSLVSLRVERSLCLIGRATMRFADAGFVLSAGTGSAGGSFAIGSTVTIAIASTTVFTGKVTGVGLEQHAGESAEFAVVADDAACGLIGVVKPKAYLNMSYADVIRELIQPAGLELKTTSTRLSSPNTYQLRTGSALDYLDLIARRTGTVWWVEGTALHVADSGTAAGSVDLRLGSDLQEFTVRASGLRPTGTRVSGWDPDQQQAILGTGSATVSADSKFVTNYTGHGPGELGAGEASTADWFPASADEAELLAGALLDGATAGSVVARGTCWANAAVAPAVTVTVSDAGPASGSYLVSTAEHAYTHRGFYTRFTAGPRRPTGLADTLGRPAPDPGFAAHGLVVGKVTDNDDPDGHGRVKVKFTALDGEIASTWARVVTIGAGAQRGFVVQPEVNDEVLVGFEFGDTRRPVVIGGLFSPKNDLPEAKKLVAGGKVDYRRITSRKNHVIEIADGADAGTQHILLKLGTAEHSVLLGADKLEMQVAAGKPVTIKAGSSKFEIAASGDVTIEGANVTIKAEQQLNLEGQAGASLKSQGQTQVQGNMLAAKGESMANVEGGGALSLKGGVVKIN